MKVVACVGACGRGIWIGKLDWINIIDKQMSNKCMFSKLILRLFEALRHFDVHHISSSIRYFPWYLIATETLGREAFSCVGLVVLVVVIK